MRVLVHLAMSPWSEKARWALDHHRVPHRRLQHLPMVYEAALRIASRDLRRPVTVPILFDGRLVLRESLDIARHADRIGENAPLLPADQLTHVLAWNDVAERLLSAGRARSLARMLESPPALREQLPGVLRALGLVPLARLGVHFVNAKHGSGAIPSAASEGAMSAALEQLEAALVKGDHLAGKRFTFADVAMACALGFVMPHANAQVGPGVREVFTDRKIAEAFPAAVAWRDRIVAQFR